MTLINGGIIYFTPDGTRMGEMTGQRLRIREDGRVELVCDHGVGHPIGHIRKDGWGAPWMGVHGCCVGGCCSKRGADSAKAK